MFTISTSEDRCRQFVAKHDYEPVQRTLALADKKLITWPDMEQWITEAHVGAVVLVGAVPLLLGQITRQDFDQKFSTILTSIVDSFDNKEQPNE